MKSLFAIVALAALFSAPAFAAGQCDADIKAIDEALAKNPQLSTTDADALAKLRAEAEKKLAAGKDAECVAAAAQAKKLLGI